jgi:hypothetical protein
MYPSCKKNNKIKIEKKEVNKEKESELGTILSQCHTKH